jgi:hypothetical protein
VVVSGAADGPGAEVTRTLWYEAIAGAAYAAQNGGKTLTRRVLDPSGNVLSTETDPVSPLSDANAPTTRTAAAIAQAAQQRLAALGAQLVEADYSPSFGGTSELVVQPENPDLFLKTAGNMAAAIGPLTGKAFLITILDSKQTPALILGYTPGLGGGLGQGIGWEASNVHSGLMWGAQGH